MCPACMATAALIVAGTASADGLAAFAMKALRAKAGAKRIDPTPQTRGGQNESPRRIAL